MDGVELIAAERRRQVEEEGWTPEHDDGHMEGSLALVAGIYALPAYLRELQPWREDPEGPTYYVPRHWPWAHEWYKPDYTAGQNREARIKELVKAGALVAAEIDRLKRAGTA